MMKGDEDERFSFDQRSAVDMSHLENTPGINDQSMGDRSLIEMNLLPYDLKKR